jgi:carboxylesterase
MNDYQINLNGSDNAVLLIHGLTGSPFELKYVARKLNKAGYTVKAPCLAGHGTSIMDLKKTRWQDWYRTASTTFKKMKEEYQSVSVAGLCMGALFALYLAYEMQEEVSSIALLSTTLAYDGWSLPWYKFLLPLSYYPPFKYFCSFSEREPYGLKDERMRRQIEIALKDNSVAYSEFPAHCVHELYQHIRVVKKILPKVKSPTLILHALEDDLASVNNAHYVHKHIGSTIIRKVILDDSYHMLPLDKQKDLVAEEMINFFKLPCSLLKAE